MCETLQFHFISFLEKVEKISLERSHKGKKYIFSFGFLQNLFDCFLILRVFFRLINIFNLKALKIGL